MTLFTSTDLGQYLGVDVTVERADVVESVVWGWLGPTLGLAERPFPVPENVKGWALELGAIAFTNPAGLRSHEAGPASQTFATERRAEILAIAARSAGAAGLPLSPLGSFPDPEPYPSSWPMRWGP